MKKLSPLLLAVFLVLPQSPGVHAQGVVCALGLPTTGYKAAADQPPPAAIAKQLKATMSLLCPKGCGRIALFQNGTISSVLMMTLGNGASKIVFNPAFMQRLQTTHGSAARLGVLAHEVGHHVDANGSPAAWMDPSWGLEVRADAWAGCALAKAGMTVEGVGPALQASGALASPGASDPAWGTRAVALQRGYSSCAGAGQLRRASLDVAANSAKVSGGCASNSECKTGRWCQEGRCRDRTSRGVCLKDIDCPDTDICSTAGRCEPPAGSGRADGASATTVVSLAPDTGRDGAKSMRPASDCRTQCDSDRRRCRVSAVASLNQCLGRLRSSPTYVSCACPNWPADKPDCHKACEDAFEGAETCESNYVPARDACLSSLSSCSACEPAAIAPPAFGREAALK